MKARATTLAFGAVALVAAFATLSCSGSETNWFGLRDPKPASTVSTPEKPGFFADCFADEDCNKGKCLCGTCTRACSKTADCPSDELASCAAGDSLPYAAQCGGAADVKSGLCLHSCTADSSCPGGRACVAGLCAHPVDYTGPMEQAATPPPPISGGTLALIDDEQAAAVSDPEHDRVHFVRFDRDAVTAVALLSPGDEPGRLLQDRSGFVHVALRRGGAVVAIDPSSGKIRERRAVCQYPRGIGYDSRTDVLYVACAGGELVTLPAAGGAATRVLHLDDDLRDIVVEPDHLLVSRFRSAELLVIDDGGRIVERTTPPGTLFPSPKSATVAWRMVAAPDGGVVMSHQLAQRSDVAVPTPIPVFQSGYGAPGAPPCQRIVAVAVTRFDANGHVVWSRPNIPATLPVDVAVTTNDLVTIAPAGQESVPQTITIHGKLSVPRGQGVGGSSGAGGGGSAAGAGGVASAEPCPSEFDAAYSPGELVAAAYTAAGKLVTQTREPPQVVFDGRVISLGVASVVDTGHILFHRAQRSGLACASCHPEGTEDGHVWQFEQFGKRRTQALGGRVSATAPFHWSGDMTDFARLVRQVMTVRMSGFRLDAAQVGLLADWIDSIPAWRGREMADASAVERGRTLFDSEDVGCATCHAGSALTNNETVDVGTGSAFQVPSLRGVSRRAPFMHDGCAATLLDRFGACGGGDAHGFTSQLSADQLLDLTTYLETL
jgi:hypothetical protein